MAIFDEETGERLDGPDGKWAKEKAPKAMEEKSAGPKKDSKPKSDDKKPAKTSKKES